MPLRDHYPVIDDRTYDDIVAEARTRIPRYTPEWTDVNETDPGMTLVELFAWLSEMQIYRMSKVPELNYLKFLELIGIELEPAKPASAQVTFPVKKTYAEPYVVIPRRTRIATDEPDDRGPIVFETDEALVALTAQLDAVQAFDGFGYADVSLENVEAGAGFEPFGRPGRADAALYLGFDYTGDFPQAAFSLAVWVAGERGKARPMSCTPRDLVAYPPADIRWEYWDGKHWSGMDLLEDETNSFTRSGFVYLKSPEKGRMKTSSVGKVGAKRYWIRARVATSDYEAPPRVVAVRSNTVSVTQAETISNELVGGSNGQPDQVFGLAHAPVLKDTLVLRLDEGQGFQDWAEVPDFFGSGRDDLHHVLNRSTGEIRFGAEENHIPVANPNRPNNIVAVQYRVGGGKRGNVPAGTIVSPLTSLPGVDVARIGNLFAGTGGADEETMRQAKARAPQAIKSRERAVTAEDYELLAVRAGNIARAKALPLHHADYPNVSVPGVVSVIVVPDVDGEAPMPSEATLKTVCAYLNERRLLTAELYVLKPTYRKVEVDAELIAADDADLAEVKVTAETSLKTYFHPLRGGEDSTLEEHGSGWGFGDDVYYSKVYSRLLIPGVKRIAGLTIAIDGERCPPCSDVHIDGWDLLFNGNHDIRVSYDFGQQ
jgi:predicted phage baseplate assembly protein